MDELTGRPATNAGIDDAVAGMAVGIIRGPGEIQNVARELPGFSHDKIGSDQMGGIVAATRGRSHFA
jgi:hypothetical protein